MCFGFACVNPHANFDGSFAPFFRLQPVLRIYGGVKSVTSGVECHTEGIANDLKDITMVGFHGFFQNSMMPCPSNFPHFRMFSCEFCTAFDIAEEEGDCTRRKII